MARTENEKTRDTKIVNLLNNIWNELKILNTSTYNQLSTLNTNIWAVIENDMDNEEEDDVTK